MGEIPNWLSEALENHEPWSGDRGSAGAAGPGSVCAVEGDGLRRLALVVGLEEGIAQLELLTNEVDLAGGHDVLLPRAETGLGFDLLLERDMTGPAFHTQLGPRLGAVDLASLEGRAPAGIPIVRREDGRWGWKLAELGELHRLCGACLRWLLDG